MSSPEVFTAVKTLLEAQFADAPLVWPNEGVTPDSSAPWVYVDASSFRLFRIELGVGAMEERGLVWCHIYVPVGTGTETARTLGKALSNIFRSYTRDSPVSFGEQALGAGEPGDDDGMFWRQTLTVNYSYQDQET